ncbi:hypothetical protein HF673_09305 [Acidithiobacillus thiooxidans]|uniref:Uncharacterized protein n=1 Tax=Acidithiobacillus thiooxidans ATCC 19377 TaxID=637390 RepID=A0A5P9XSZ3_ACITH|nr:MULTISPECIES: hypothetical protein [Acidithiobacillus]MBU2835956.1 hypothetical protein [Acidithiobacillus thiooxidans]MDA8177436.1 hypothetical protein [Acidithiobacillus sp.]QFX97161.1 hypothetical protein GCD22_03043 [Acidithiobacillus thiooxidans ATCC 19377]
MADSQELHCPRCGSEQFKHQDDLIVCMICGHAMRFEDLQLVALLDMLVDDIEATRH